MGDDWLTPDWPAPPSVRAVSTTRRHGVSAPPFDTLNLGPSTDDDPAAVARNHQALRAATGMPAAPCWLRQVHGTRVVAAHEHTDEPPEADAVWTDRPGRPCGVLTADCLPVLLCDRDGTRVAAAHAGWRGLAAGVLEAAVAAMGADGHRVLAWLGPAIGPGAFEVGEEVRDAFTATDPGAVAAFRPGRPGHWYADLHGLAGRRLHALGVTAIHGGGLCTHSDPARFFSYRRDGATGRMGSVIWLAP